MMIHEVLYWRRGPQAHALGVLLLAGGLLIALPTAAQAQTPTSTTAVPGATAPETQEAVKVINDLLAAKWKDENGKVLYTPAEHCSDYEFIRRASLDIIGRIAKVEEIQHYLKDPPSVRRALLIDRLLANPEYVQNWSTIWTYWLMTRTGDRLYKDQLHLWLEEMFSQDVMSIKDLAVKLITATGRTNDNGAVNYILSQLGGSTAGTGRRARPTPQLLAKEGQFDMVPVTSRTIRLFLGYQIQCTQCHDHPFNADWKQKHFWGVNAFFRQTQRIGEVAMRRRRGMPQGPLTLVDNPDFNKKGVVYYEKRNGVFLPSEPMFLDGTKLGHDGSQLPLSRRQQLAKFLTAHQNFSKAYVNRMWGHFFGRGMNEKPTADDFGEHNPVVQEELLDKMGETFIAANYNPKSLIRWICLSDAYQLKAVANKSNEKPEDEPYFSRQLLKAMSPEQLFDSLLTATQPHLKRDDDAQKQSRAQWLRRLTQNFGDDEGNEATFNGTVVQALLLMNGRDLNGALTAKEGTLARAKSLKARAAINHLFLAALNRPATSAEYRQLAAHAALRGVKEQNADAALTDMFWALLNCNEFILNH